MIELKMTDRPVDEIPGQLTFITTYADERPLKGNAGLVDWRLNGKLSHFILDSKFTGNDGESLLMPTRGRIDANELLVYGVGNKGVINDHSLPSLLSKIVEKILLKGNSSFCLSISDVVPGMFEWRNAVRLFMSMLSGQKKDLQIFLAERKEFIEDAKRRHMDFAFDVKVSYELV